MCAELRACDSPGLRGPQKAGLERWERSFESPPPNDSPGERGQLSPSPRPRLGFNFGGGGKGVKMLSPGDLGSSF